MTAARRALDLSVAVPAALVLLPLAIGVALSVRLGDGGPALYASERMRAPGRPFRLWKFRTMTEGAEDGGVSGGDKAARVTRIGAVLRRYRLDEIPQLWNVIRGDMALVGPRPPLRRYVERFPALYAEVLAARPGLTGAATLRFRRREEALLARCATPAETDRIYATRCVRAKARLDLAYERRRTIVTDLALIAATCRGLLERPSAGAGRRPSRATARA
jgi:lipopolysaccharide/colanic/teichoic acid biosynthesis glycosyltransferase